MVWDELRGFKGWANARYIFWILSKDERHQWMTITWALWAAWNNLFFKVSWCHLLRRWKLEIIYGRTSVAHQTKMVSIVYMDFRMWPSSTWCLCYSSFNVFLRLLLYWAYLVAPSCLVFLCVRCVLYTLAHFSHTMYFLYISINKVLSPLSKKKMG